MLRHGCLGILVTMLAAGCSNQQSVPVYTVLAKSLAYGEPQQIVAMRETSPLLNEECRGYILHQEYMQDRYDGLVVGGLDYWSGWQIVAKDVETKFSTEDPAKTGYIVLVSIDFGPFTNKEYRILSVDEADYNILRLGSVKAQTTTAPAQEVARK